MSTTTKWIPLESNPQVFSDYAASLGFPTSEYAFHDIFGLDPDLLAFVPTPVKAVLLLFPTGETINRVRREEEEGGILKEGEEGGVLWIPQTIGNACGTMGLLHAMANASVEIPSEAPIRKFFDECKTLPASERTALLSSADFLERAHTTASTAGQNQLREEDHDTNLHFVAFVHAKGKDGKTHLIELDGGRSGALDRGPSEDLLSDTARVVKEVYMAADPESEQFSLMALAPAQQED